MAGAGADAAWPLRGGLALNFKLVKAVRKLSLPHTEKSVLGALAEHAHDDGSWAYPSVRTLASECSLSPRTVQKALRRLEKRRLIEPMKVSGGRRSTVYRVTPGNYGQSSLFEGLHPRTPGRRTAHQGPATANGSASNRERRSPEVSGKTKEPPVNQQSAAAAPPVDWIPLDAWAAYIEMRRIMRRPLSPLGVDLVIRKLAELREEGNDPRGVLEQCVRGGWTELYPLRGPAARGGTRAEERDQKNLRTAGFIVH
jgi:Helix-turn-helix domain